MTEQLLNAYRAGDTLVLLRRDEQGKLIERRQRAEFSFFLTRADYQKVVGDIRASERRGLVQRVVDEGNHYRVLCRDEDFRRLLLFGTSQAPGYFDQHGIQGLEADVHPVSRYLVDSRCEIQKPRAGCLDLETDSRVPFARKESARILCWNLATEAGDRVGGILEEDTDEAEAELIKDLLYELGEVDQVRCWNGLKFDEPVLRARARRYGIRVDFNRWLWLDNMLCFGKYNAASKSGAEKESLALDRVAESLGIDVAVKRSVDASKSWDYWSAGGAERQALFERNAFDAQSMLQIEAKTGYCALHYAVCRTSGCLPDTRSLKALVHVEAFLMRLGAERGMRFPSKRRFGDEAATPEQFEGAFVFEPVVAMHFGVHVCDFAGMYPSIIQSWNISPETHVPELSGKRGESYQDVAKRLPPGHCVTPRTLQVFRTEEPGILAVAVGFLKETRRYYNDKRDACEPKSREWWEWERLSQGCKIAVNSIFGGASSYYSRVYKQAVGESITTTGAWLIQATMEKGVREWQMVPLAGDTDSLFAKGIGAAACRDFKDACNRDLYPALVKSCGCVRNELKLEYEKSYAIQVITGKKRYCSRLAEVKGKQVADPAPEIRGLEFVRGDQQRLTREMQMQAIRKLLLIGQEIVTSVPKDYPLQPSDFHDLIRSWKRRVLEDPLTMRDVVISQGLKGPPESYEKEPNKDGSPAALPLHVEVAKVLEQRGEDVSEGARIEYVVTDADAKPRRAIPASDYQPGMEDRAYLWEKKVWPPTRRLLEAVWPEHNWGVFDEGKDRGGGKGKSAYLPGQVHFSFWNS